MSPLLGLGMSAPEAPGLLYFAGSSGTGIRGELRARLVLVTPSHNYIVFTPDRANKIPLKQMGNLNMSDTLLASIVGGLFALAAAISAVAYQNSQSRKEKIAAEQKSVIKDLISFRFVLTANSNRDPQSLMHFNAALSAIPVEFSHCKNCMDKYRSIGNNFTVERYYELILALMNAVPLDASVIDKHMLENVPSAKP